MSGAILQPPLQPDADWGVVFIEVSGCLPMCGHGTIGVATVLVETGMVSVFEPETVVRLDTPAGLVEARVAVEDGRARSVALRNVPSFLLGRDRQVEVNGGTGTSAKLAALHARGELGVGEEFVNRSVIGTRFGGRIVAETSVAGLPAVVPEITGRAWITGMGQYVLDPEDPFPAGFSL